MSGPQSRPGGRSTQGAENFSNFSVKPTPRRETTREARHVPRRKPPATIAMKTCSAHPPPLPAPCLLSTRKHAAIAFRFVPARAHRKPASRILGTPVDQDPGSLVFAALFILVAVAIFLCVQTMLDFSASPGRSAASPLSDSTPAVGKSDPRKVSLK